MWPNEPPRSGWHLGRLVPLFGAVRYYGPGIVFVSIVLAIPLYFLLAPGSEPTGLSDAEITQLIASARQERLDAAKPESSAARMDQPTDGTARTGPVTTNADRSAVAAERSIAPQELWGAPGSTAVSSAEHLTAPWEQSPRAPTAPQAGRSAPPGESPTPSEHRSAATGDHAEGSADRSTAATDPEVVRATSSVSRQAGGNTPQGDVTGSLTVLVRPWGSIFVDGVLRKQHADVQFTTTLPTGSHVVRVEHPLLGSREHVVEIRSDRPQHVVIDLLQDEAGTATDGPSYPRRVAW